MSTVTSPPTYMQLLSYIHHSDNEALYEEGIVRNLSVGQYLARIEAVTDTRSGNWFFGPYNDLNGAREYAQYIADLGREGIRQNSALPHIWPSGSCGNSVDLIRIYRVVAATPAIASFAAPQDETGSVMATPDQIAAAKAGTYQHAPQYEGQGHQLSLPVVGAGTNHGLEIVKRVTGEEFYIMKN